MYLYPTAFGFEGRFLSDNGDFSPPHFPRARINGQSISNFGGDIFIPAQITGLNFGLVPEPSTWAMLIAGFGLTGAAMRRRRSFVLGRFSA